MADSRLTDLPNLTTPNSDDVLYIVDVSQDSSNKITYANLVSNTIDSLSTYIQSIDLPSVNGILTDVAILSATQLTKANQEDLETTDNNLNILQSNVLVYAGQITKNAGNIVALSGYIDGKALASDLIPIENDIATLSASVLTKASQAEVDLKADQNDVILLTSLTNTTSANVVNLNDQLVITNAFTLELQTIIDTNEADILVNQINVSLLSSTKAEATLLDQLSAQFIADQEDNLNASVFTFPFNVNVATNTSYITSFYNLVAPLSGTEVENNGTTAVFANLSSSDGNIGNWNGLLVNTYVLSSEAIQVSIYNPTASTISFNNTNIVFTLDDINNI